MIAVSRVDARPISAKKEDDPQGGKATTPPEAILEKKVLVNFIAIAADSVEQLRRCDVYRVLSSVRRDNVDGMTREALGAWISERRLDLAQEVGEVLAELAEQSAQP